MGAKERFEYDSVQDQETIVKCLQAIVDGFDKGHLTFSHRDKSIQMEPCGLLRFALEAHSKGKMRSLKLKVKWEQACEGDRAALEPLTITSEPAPAEPKA
ncbi:MAG: amphi-Trp domain-containing protein [Syntrophobacteraceae bacterium]